MQPVIHFTTLKIQKESRIRYVLDFLQQHPLAPKGLHIFSSGSVSTENAIRVMYAPEPPAPGIFWIPAQRIAFDDKIPNFSKLEANTYLFENLNLFSTEIINKRAAPFIQNRCFGFDVLETIFLHISRYEEHHHTPEQCDEWDMMKTSAQFLSKNKLQRIPVVDHLVFAFFKALGLKPKKSKTQYQMSHDIDAIEKFPSLYKTLRASARLIKDGRSLKSQMDLWKLFGKVTKKEEKDPFDTFSWLLLPNDRLWDKKVIYFGAGGNTRFDNFYQLEHPRLLEVFEAAQNNGYEFGLHPSYDTWKNEAMWREELEKLEKVVGKNIKHSRQHFLHYAFEETSEIIESNGIVFDSTIGYQEIIGFRCGTGFPYAMYCFKEERAYHFLEEPMIVMDCGLLKEVGNDLDLYEEVLKDFLKKNRFLTRITFNFHNSTFDPVRLNREQMIRIYQTLGELEED